MDPASSLSPCFLLKETKAQRLVILLCLPSNSHSDHWCVSEVIYFLKVQVLLFCHVPTSVVFLCRFQIFCKLGAFLRFVRRPVLSLPGSKLWALVSTDGAMLRIGYIHVPKVHPVTIYSLFSVPQKIPRVENYWKFWAFFHSSVF